MGPSHALPKLHPKGPPFPQTFPITESTFFHFYFLAIVKRLPLHHLYSVLSVRPGRLVTRKQLDPHSYIVYLDPSNGPDVKFIHAVVDLSISTILSPIDTPLVVQSFFDHDRAISHDELLNEIGWVTRLLHEAVANHDDKAVHEFLESWVKAPRIYQMDQNFDPYSVMIGSSPRFNMYGNDFGLGKALEVRSGYANKISGKVTMYLGFEGCGSLELEVCLCRKLWLLLNVMMSSWML